MVIAISHKKVSCLDSDLVENVAFIPSHRAMGSNAAGKNCHVRNIEAPSYTEKGYIYK